MPPASRYGVIKFFKTANGARQGNHMRAFAGKGQALHNSRCRVMRLLPARFFRQVFPWSSLLFRILSRLEMLIALALGQQGQHCSVFVAIAPDGR